MRENVSSSWISIKIPKAHSGGKKPIQNSESQDL